MAEEQEGGEQNAKADEAVKRVDDDGAGALSKIQSTQKFVYIAMLVNVVFLIGVGAFVVMKLSPKQGEVDAGQIVAGESGGHAASGGEHGAPAAGEHGAPATGTAATPGAASFIKESFTVNLADPGRNHFAKVDVDIEITDDFVKEEVTRLVPKIRDFIVIVLSSKTYDQIITVDGKDFLREEIRNKINGYLSRGQIKNVYFSQFIIQ